MLDWCHLIRPKNADGFLDFFCHKFGHFVVFASNWLAGQVGQHLQLAIVLAEPSDEQRASAIMVAENNAASP